ncbi:MAG: GAF domain-containing protein [Acetobacteraceae bacterium]|nr:GAF domain-containing protein [Acetobacteraceae bacterium]
MSASLAAALAAPGQPEASFRAIEAVLGEIAGHRLFTVLVLDQARGVSWRAWTSDAEAYPLGGEKPIRPGSEHHRLVIEAGQPRLCPDRAAIVAAFPDHERILALGCESAVNVPVRWNGTTLGGLNLLDRAGAYSAAQFPILLQVAAFAVAPILHLLQGDRP